MKRFVIIASLMMLAMVFLSAKCEPEDAPLVLDGQWQITQFTTKAVSIGGQQVDVYISFNSDHSFELYQMLGTGRYRKYAGTWTLTDNKLLSGTYEGSVAWATSYEVTMDDAQTQMTLTSTATPQEVSVYRKQTIPEDVINNAL